MSSEESHETTIQFHAFSEQAPAGRLSEYFKLYWPAYRDWMKRAEQFSRLRCEQLLRTHMPELVPAYESLLEAAGDSDDKARFLSLFCPPQVVRACSQVVLDTIDGPVLIRNYDHAPAKCDGLILHSRWCNTSVIAPTDCIWGALDGVNDRGLAAALAFGGRQVSGDGFSAPLIVRYLLETCSTVAEAIRALSRLPCYMPYIFVVVDAGGDYATVHLAPDRPAAIRRRRASTNHRLRDDWPDYVRFSQSVERLDAIQRCVRERVTMAKMLEAFLTAPVRRTDYANGAGTLYTVAYHPAGGSAEFSWPGRQERFQVDHFEERAIEVKLGDSTSFGSAGNPPVSQ